MSTSKTDLEDAAPIYGGQRTIIIDDTLKNQDLLKDYAETVSQIYITDIEKGKDEDDNINTLVELFPDFDEFSINVLVNDIPYFSEESYDDDFIIKNRSKLPVFKDRTAVEYELSEKAKEKVNKMVKEKVKKYYSDDKMDTTKLNTINKSIEKINQMNTDD